MALPETRKKAKEFQQPLFPLLKKELTRSQRKMAELLRSGELLPSSSYQPLKRYAEQLTLIEAELSLSSHGKTDLIGTIAELENQICILQAKLRGTAKSKPKKHRTPSRHNEESESRSRKSKPRKEEEEEEEEEVDWKVERANFKETVNNLNAQVESQRAELKKSNSQQQEAVNNVKKLAQVVKLMKSKYDTLKEQVGPSPLASGSIDEALGEVSRSLETESSPSRQEILLRDCGVAYSATRLEYFLPIQVEEVITIKYDGLSAPLKEEEKAFRSIDQISSMVDQLPSLGDADSTNEGSSILAWHILPQEQPSISGESMWDQLPSEKLAPWPPVELPDTESLLFSIRLLDDDALTPDQMGYLCSLVSLFLLFLTSQITYQPPVIRRGTTHQGSERSHSQPI